MRYETSDDDHMAVTCGSFIKVQSKHTGYYHSSEEKQLGGGCGQQIVTFQKNRGTQVTMWVVRAANHSNET